jgi:hypothetical protein
MAAYSWPEFASIGHCHNGRSSLSPADIAAVIKHWSAQGITVGSDEALSVDF